MKKILALLLAMMLLFTASAYADNDDEVINIRLVHSKQEIVDQLDASIVKFEETHPNINIEAEFLSDYTTTIKTLFNSGDEPDIFTVIGNTDVKLWAEYLEDLSNEPWAADVNDIARDAVTLDGSLYGFPVTVEGYGYMYNPDMLASVGVTEMPKTYDDFAAIVDALESNGMTALTELYSSYYQLGNFWVNVGFARQDNPAAFIDGLYNGTETFVGNKEFIDLANFLQYDAAHAADPMNTTFSLQVSNFADSVCAMTIGGNWNEPTLESSNAAFRYGLMPICINDDVEKNDNLFIGVNVYWSINKNADEKVKEASKEFFTWLATTEEGNKCMTEEMRLIPAFNSVIADEAQLGSLSADLVKALAEGKVLGMYFSYFPDGGSQALGTVTQELVAGNLTTEEYLVKLQDAWDNLL